MPFSKRRSWSVSSPAIAPTPAPALGLPGALPHPLRCAPAAAPMPAPTATASGSHAACSSFARCNSPLPAGFFHSMITGHAGNGGDQAACEPWSVSIVMKLDHPRVQALLDRTHVSFTVRPRGISAPLLPATRSTESFALKRLRRLQVACVELVVGGELREACPRGTRWEGPAEPGLDLARITGKRSGQQKATTAFGTESWTWRTSVRKSRGWLSSLDVRKTERAACEG